MDKFELLKKYKELLDAGVIEQSEFDIKKKELLADEDDTQQTRAGDVKDDEEKRKSDIYDAAIAKTSERSVKAFSEAINDLKAIEDWGDSREVSSKLQSELEIIRKEEKEADMDKRYRAAVGRSRSMSISDVRSAVNDLLALGDWKDSREYLQKSRKRLEQLENARQEARKKNIRILKITAAAAGIIILILLAASLIRDMMRPDLSDTGNMKTDTLHGMSFSRPESWTLRHDDEMDRYRRYILKEDGEALSMIEIYYAGETDLSGDAAEDDSREISDAAEKTIPDPGVVYDVVNADDSSFEVTLYYKKDKVRGQDELFDVIRKSIDTEGYDNPRKLTKSAIEYSGSTEAGTVVSTDDIKITETYDTGTAEGTREIDDFSIAEKVTLKAGQTSKVKIDAGGKRYTHKITCTTITEAQYKAECRSRNYKNQLRKASYGKYITIYGQVLQDCGYGRYRISSSGGYDNVYMVKAADSDIVEDDWVTVYGKTDGIYEYETVMGASQKIPSIEAEYVDR